MSAKGLTFQLIAVALCWISGALIQWRWARRMPMANGSSPSRDRMCAPRGLSLACSGCCRSCRRPLLQPAKLLGQGAYTHGTGRLLMARSNDRCLEHSHWDQVARYCLHCVRGRFGQFDRHRSRRFTRRYLGRCPSERHPLLYSRAMRAPPRVMLVTRHQHCGVLDYLNQAHLPAALEAQYRWCAFRGVGLRRRRAPANVIRRSTAGQTEHCHV
jgi:hypothetical protein